MTTAPGTPALILADLPRIVHQHRIAAAAAKERLDQARAEWETAHATLIHEAREWSDALAHVETMLRETAVAHFKATGDKRPAPGVAIRLVITLAYDEAEALRWAKHHDVALALDKRLFEKIAKVTPPEFVAIRTAPQATIATDLEAALKEIA